MGNARLGGDPVVQALNGLPEYLGTIDATTTSKTNAEATTPFNASGDALGGKVLLIHNSGSTACRVYGVTTSTGTVTNTRGAGNAFGVPIAPDSIKPVTMTGTRKFLAVVMVSGTANVDVWEMF